MSFQRSPGRWVSHDFSDLLRNLADVPDTFFMFSPFWGAGDREEESKAKRGGPFYLETEKGGWGDFPRRGGGVGHGGVGRVSAGTAAGCPRDTRPCRIPGMEASEALFVFFLCAFSSPQLWGGNALSQNYQT